MAGSLGGDTGRPFGLTEGQQTLPVQGDQWALTGGAGGFVPGAGSVGSRAAGVQDAALPGLEQRGAGRPVAEVPGGKAPRPPGEGRGRDFKILEGRGGEGAVGKLRNRLQAAPLPPLCLLSHKMTGVRRGFRDHE